MLPLVFLPDTPTLLAGRGEALAKRRAVLAGAGFSMLAVHEGLPPPAMLDGMRLVFGAGLAPDESAALAAAARERGIAVNIEDVPALCDMHVPAIVRRGGLVLSVSTGGSAPALASVLRERLADIFGPEWSRRLEELAELRSRLRAQGASPAAVRAAVDAATVIELSPICHRPVAKRA